jgi:hypothetical protein
LFVGTWALEYLAAGWMRKGGYAGGLPGG